jgi:hypothetical protein
MRLYLDQKDWISVARVRLQKAEPSDRRVVEALAKGFATGRLIVPFSESHVLETGLRQQPIKWLDVAMTIMLLSKRHSIAPLHSLWVQEADAFLARRFGVSVDGAPQPFGKGLAFALGTSEDELTLPWTPDASDAEIAIIEMYFVAEPVRSGPTDYDRERQARREAWAASMASISRELAKDREKYNEQDRLAMLALMLPGNEMIGRAIGHGVPDVYLAVLREEGPWAVVKEMPSLAVLSELLRLSYRDTTRRWTPNDYYDLGYLSTALAYCDAVCPDKYWGDLAMRSEHIASSGVIITTGQDAVPQAVEQLLAGVPR